MKDEKGFGIAKQKILRISEYRINDLGHKMCIASTSEKGIPGIVTIIYGAKIGNLSFEDRLNIEVNIPEEIIFNDQTYAIRVSYIK